MKELDNLVSEINFLTKTALGQDAHLDTYNLTLMGHGFGATTAIAFSAKDERVRKLITFDPWLMPIYDEIMNKSI